MPEAVSPVDVLLVTSPGCHYCEQALRLLDEIAGATPLRVRTVLLSSEEGRALMVRHRAPFPPILLVDGDLFGYGRISRKKLERHFAHRAVNVMEV